MNYDYPAFYPAYEQAAVDPYDQRVVPGLGLGIGFLGGLATGALLTPGPGFGYYYPPYPYYPYYPPYPYPYPYYPY